jgi:monoamine oxidase
MCIQRAAAQVQSDNGDGIDLGAHWIGRTQHHLLQVSGDSALLPNPLNLTHCMPQVLKRLNMTDLLYNQFITGTKILEIDSKVTHYKTSLPWLGPLRELDFGLFIAAISAVIKGVSRDSPWNSSAFVMNHDGMTTQSFCSGFPWDKATTEVTAAATRAVFGKEIEELSALQYAHYSACSGGVLPLLDATPGGAQEFKLLGGTQQISDTLAQPLRLIHDRNVVAISQDESGVTLRAFDSSFSIFTYTARRVVVATPPHISASFQYSPPLPPNKQKLLQHLTQGHMIKTVVIYPVAFWRNNGFSGEVVSSSGAGQTPFAKSEPQISNHLQTPSPSATTTPSPTPPPSPLLSSASWPDDRVSPPASSLCSSGSSSCCQNWLNILAPML